MGIYPFKEHNPKLDDSVFVAPNAAVVGKVTIGEGTNVWFGTAVRGDVNTVTIGKHCNIQDNATIHTMSDAPIEIGDNVTIGHNAIIHCSKVGDNCLLGMGCIIMGHAEIGNNCVIGANTCITQGKIIPDNCLVYGNPAHIIRNLRDDEIEALTESTEKYYRLGQEYKEQYDKL